jgi:hypothetical protein
MAQAQSCSDGWLTGSSLHSQSEKISSCIGNYSMKANSFVCSQAFGTQSINLKHVCILISEEEQTTNCMLRRYGILWRK